MNELSTIAGACREIERAQRAQWEHDYAELLYRSVRRAIDDACEHVEQVNLAGGGDCPAEVAALVDYLGFLADEPAPAPTTSWAAHDRLFHLASVLLGWPRDAERRPFGPPRRRAA